MPVNKKILICTGIYPPDIGGPATYSRLLRDFLPEADFETVDVLSFGEVRHLPKVVRHLAYFLKIRRKCKENDFGVIFAQDPVSVGLPSLLAAKFFGKKFLLKIVGDYAWEQFQSQISNLSAGRQDLKSKKFNFTNLEEFQNGKFDFKTELRRKIQKFVAKRADKIIVPGDYLKNIVLKWGVKENKIKVIYNALDLKETKQSKEEIRKELNLTGTVLISAGRLVPWKGFGALIKIMPDLAKKIPDVMMVIIGDGPQKAELKSMVSELEIGEKVRLVGQVNHDDLMDYLKAGDIFVLNTGYEGFSHLILEAMAMAIPVIATKAGGNAELIENGKDGLLVEYGDPEVLKQEIFNLYNDKATGFYFSENARKKARNFSKERMLEETADLLKTL